MVRNRTEELQAAFQKVGVRRGRELTALGFSRVLVSDAVRRGAILKVGRGLYATADSAKLSEKHSLVQVAQRAPNAVFCLLSACRIHGITTQNPREVWFAIGVKAWAPKIEFLKTRVVRLSGRALTEGVETHCVEGVEIRVYGVAKTIADLFKFRNKFGLDIAIEALRDALAARKCTIAEVIHFAKMRGVTKTVEPYLNALVQ